MPELLPAPGAAVPARVGKNGASAVDSGGDVGGGARVVDLALDFHAACVAIVVDLLAVLQACCLPVRPSVDRGARSAVRAVLADWRPIAADRPFLLFVCAMSGSYVLAFRVCLALPLRARDLFGGQTGLVTGAVFAASALAAPGR
ncbi:hypothetical protein QEZ40_000302 [Streptomyces katrae]|uniref:Uncharacterized protein n=1 Tax=Streptomyces katrae TaxID=68223 RepID=A0ABT7GN88_9ACTN|nr:hypothetical protein [Streptomyces katrae]MDK9494430.1 hypothetical protein [Streptomyces katrae]